MGDSISDRVVAFVAEERGEDREKLRLTTTLSKDLGMDGDDAVEFFEKFGKEFSVDLRGLGPDWSFYFGPEGTPPAGVLLVVAPGLIAAIVLGETVPIIPSWIWFVVSFFAWICLLVLWSKWKIRAEEVKPPQITIQDLIECANSRSWSKPIPELVRTKYGSLLRYGGLGKWFTP